MGMGTGRGQGFGWPFPGHPCFSPNSESIWPLMPTTWFPLFYIHSEMQANSALSSAMKNSRPKSETVLPDRCLLGLFSWDRWVLSGLPVCSLLPPRWPVRIAVSGVLVGRGGQSFQRHLNNGGDPRRTG